MEVHQGQDARERHLVLLVEDAEGEAERGLEAGDAVGGALELDLFLVRGVGGVVGGDAVDGAVEQGFDDRETVVLVAQGWVHLGVGVVGGCCGRRSRPRLAGDRLSVRVKWCGAASQVTCRPCCLAMRMAWRAFGCRYVLDVEVGAECLRSLDVAEEVDVALDDAGLGLDGHAAEAEAEGDGAGVHAAAAGEAGVLGVLGDGQAEAGGGDQRGAHDAVFEDGLAVVGEADGSGRGEGFVVGEGLAQASRGWRRAWRGSPA